MLKWPHDLLAARLSQGLDRRPEDLHLLVKSVDVVRRGESTTIRLVVEASDNVRPIAEVWQVDLPADEATLEELTDLHTFVLIYRAALEEWWDVRGYEPRTAERGHRLG